MNLGELTPISEEQLAYFLVSIYTTAYHTILALSGSSDAIIGDIDDIPDLIDFANPMNFDRLYLNTDRPCSHGTISTMRYYYSMWKYHVSENIATARIKGVEVLVMAMHMSLPSMQHTILGKMK